MGYYIVGIDFGGTKIASALLDTDLHILKSESVPTQEANRPERVADQLVDSVARLTEGLGREAVLGVGVAGSGVIEPGSGRVLYSPALRWHDVPLGQMLRDRLRTEVYVDNDINMAALGEWQFGAAKGARDMVCVSVGSGIGAGLVLGGHLYEGANGFAGEVGHLTIDWDGPPCPCGNRGCWESYASGPAMIGRVRHELEQGARSSLAEFDELTVELIGEAGAEGDALAERAIAETAEYLGAGLSSLVNTLNPEVLVLGGGVIRGVPGLIEQAEASLRRRALREMCRDLDVRPASFGREAGVIGAGVLVKLAGHP